MGPGKWNWKNNFFENQFATAGAYTTNHSWFKSFLNKKMKIRRNFKFQVKRWSLATIWIQYKWFGVGENVSIRCFVQKFLL